MLKTTKILVKERFKSDSEEEKNRNLNENIIRIFIRAYTRKVGV